PLAPNSIKANRSIDNFEGVTSKLYFLLMEEPGMYTTQSEQRLKAISERITAILSELDNALKDKKSQQVLAYAVDVRQ
ncbi:methyl-accepting chemotaxis protein, partial [Klebsiella pneumoniae]|nr:methyl-accepting chemotaxis protein [Klebsiella pneumoniae]